MIFLFLNKSNSQVQTKKNKKNHRYLYYNQLYGIIPTQLGDLKSLQYLYEKQKLNFFIFMIFENCLNNNSLNHNYN